MDKCYICGNRVKEYSLYGPSNPNSIVRCIVCGQYTISEDLLMRMGAGQPDGFHLYSGAIKELNENGITPWIESLHALLHMVSVPTNPVEQMDRVLRSFRKRMRSAAHAVIIDDNEYALGYAQDREEYYYLLNKLVSMGSLESVGSGQFRIDTGGWNRLIEISKTSQISSQAFVAMRFHDDLTSVYDDGIYAALVGTGYEPFRIDRKEHNDRIDDRIIAEIRKSGLVVADFTMHSPGVYFEAGFALGLAIPVIWTCREDENKGLHFDTRQFNHIMWKNVADLKEQLINRINATAPSPKS